MAGFFFGRFQFFFKNLRDDFFNYFLIFFFSDIFRFTGKTFFNLKRIFLGNSAILRNSVLAFWFLVMDFNTIIRILCRKSFRIISNLRIMFWNDARRDFFFFLICHFFARFIYRIFFWNSILTVIIFVILLDKILIILIWIWLKVFSSLKILCEILFDILLNFKITGQMLICLFNWIAVNNHYSFMLLCFVRLRLFIFKIIYDFSEIFFRFILWKQLIAWNGFIHFQRGRLFIHECIRQIITLFKIWLIARGIFNIWRRFILVFRLSAIIVSLFRILNLFAFNSLKWRFIFYFLFICLTFLSIFIENFFLRDMILIFIDLEIF